MEMTEILLRVLIMSLTTVIGVTAASWVDRFERLEERKIQDLLVTLMSPAPLELSDDPKFTEMLDSLRPGDFYAMGHACGNGFITGYITHGRQRLSHSYESYDSVGEARSGFYGELDRAIVIIEGPDIVIRYGESATRYLLKREEDAETFYEIIWLKKHDTGFTAIVGSDEDNTRRLETYVLKRH